MSGKTGTSGTSGTGGASERTALDEAYAEHLAGLAQGYARALEGSGWDAVLVHSGLPRVRSRFDDQSWPLRVSPHFAHWLPLTSADCAVLVRPGRRPVLFHDVTPNFWEGPAAPESDHFWPAFEVVPVRADSAPAAAGGARVALVAEETVPAARWGIAPEAVNPPGLVAALDELRVVKSRYERLCLAEANRRAAVGHARLARAFVEEEPTELELHLRFLEATAQDDGETPYKNIVARGRNAAVLHHVAYDKRRRPGDGGSLLVDAGATCLGYHSDVTRTWARPAAACALFAELCARLEALQQEMCRRVAVGIPYERLHDESHQLLAGVLREVGIARTGQASEDELVGSGATRAFLPHGLGHSLGLQTHDVACAAVRPRAANPFLRNTRPVAVGQCFTIEPGCYFIDGLLGELRAAPVAAAIDWKVVEALRPFGGVRIEDDLVVEAGGVRNLTREAFAAVTPAARPA